MKQQWKWVIGIALFCILAPIVSFATYIGIRGYAVNSGVVVASQFLDTLRSHDYAAAHMLMAPSEQSAISVTALQGTQAQIEKQHGLWLSPAICVENPSTTLNDIWYLYIVRVESGDDMYISVRVVHTDNGWRVLEYHYDDDPA